MSALLTATKNITKNRRETRPVLKFEVPILEAPIDVLSRIGVTLEKMDSMNDVTLIADGKDLVLEWWDKQDFLRTITFREDKVILFRGKKGEEPFRAKIPPTELELSWKLLLL